MKISELIDRLTGLMNDHGNMEIMIEDGEFGDCAIRDITHTKREFWNGHDFQEGEPIIRIS